MVRFIACFFACVAFVSHGFAADGAARRVLPTANVNDAGATTAARTGAATRATTQSRTADASATTSTTNTARASRVSNAIDGGTTTTRTPISTAPGAVRTSATPTRASVSRAAGATTSTGTRGALDAAVNTVGRNARVTAASVNADPSVRRAGVTLRPSTAEVGGRAHIAGTDVQTGSNVGNNARSVSARAGVVSRESIAEARDRLEQTAELNKSCQEQYNDCMDQFCAVIDANQKRCSCSANLNQYAKAETAVKDANTQLNEVAQRIRYVGLSADEIRAILSATEAEEALSGQTDTSETRSMLADIEKLIVDPTANTSSVSTNADGLGILDIDLDFSNNSDMFNLDFLGSNSSSFSNLRGKQLFDAAKKRCNSVLSQCTDAGATAQQITGNYELAIDKDCIAYETGLKKMNETLVSNVRSAGQMLEKARLAVRKNQNQYDAKGCVAALETCMTDDMVCGSDYRKCLDPTKKYMDENGDVVLGEDISKITDSMKNYDNSKINSDVLTNAYGATIATNGDCPDTGTCQVTYLLKKIGTTQKVTDEGLCRAVLDKCQAYTYDSNGTYQPYNDIVVNYIQRAMVNIKAAQQKIISDYASSCMVDVSACYNQQVSQVNAWSTNASTDSIYNVMRGACRNVALTCAYAVFNGDDSSCPGYSNPANKTKNTGEDAKNACIQSISEMFYQSMLCPDNSMFTATKAATVALNGTISQSANSMAYVNTQCQCNIGYAVFNGKCVPKCSAGQYLGTSGTCITCTGDTVGWNGTDNPIPLSCTKKLTCPDNSTDNNGVCKCNEGYTAQNDSDGKLSACKSLCANYPGSTYTSIVGSASTTTPYITEGGYVSVQCKCNGVAYDLQNPQSGVISVRPKPQCANKCSGDKIYDVVTSVGSDPIIKGCISESACTQKGTVGDISVCVSFGR